MFKPKASSPRDQAFLPDKLPHRGINLLVSQELALPDGSPEIFQIFFKAGHESFLKREAGEPLAIPQTFQIENIEVLFKRPLKGYGQDRLAVIEGLGSEGVAAGADDIAAGGQVVKETVLGVFLKGKVAVPAMLMETIDHHRMGQGL